MSMPELSTNPARLCPKCGSSTPLSKESRAWPLDWTCSACSYRPPFQDSIVLTAPELADTVSGFDPADFDFLAKAELEHFWFSARRKLIASLARKYAPYAKSFLEIGCGSGNVLNAMARSRDWDRIVGTEIHPRGLNHASQRLPSNVELIQADARRLPFSEAFDLAGAFDVLEHISEDELVLAKVREALASGGIFIATVPQHPWLWSVADEIAYHERRYRYGELEGKLSSSGFKILFSTSYTTLLLPAMALSRLRAKGDRSDTDAKEALRNEFRVSPVLNTMLREVLNLETGLTLLGVRWPIGGSRVVVAQKG
ncbi:class I SAM-dependent methyltransferase [Microvirga sp. TS319]|uniref:class I SAM-dependent methyltransferase n=1 Tax=Microvirga sp. TS319 TaxID=3241165 RepID=UPI003519FB26